MKKLLLIITIMFVVKVGNAQTNSFDYLGQTPPGNTPVVFAPGTISLTNRRETKVVFSPDGHECLINVSEAGKFKILYSKKESGNWSISIPAYFINTSYAIEPFFSPDSQKVFFIGYNNSYLDADIYMSTRVNQTWSTPFKLGSPINSSAEEYHPTVALKGTFYFYSVRDNHIYRSKCENGNYSRIERVNIPSPYGAWDPFIAPDENYIIFTSNYPDGFGNEDQYITYYKNGAWTNPKNLGSKINTNKIEYGSYISPDNKYYFFSRPDGWGPNNLADIYWVKADFIDSLRKTNFVPYLKMQIPNQSDSAGHLFNYKLPDSAFIDDDGNNTLHYSASLSNGNHLPVWLKFDTATQTFSGTPSTAETLNIRVTAKDNANASTSVDFKIDIKSLTGIEEPKKKVDVMISPNPSNGLIKVTLRESLYKDAVIEIFDFSGKLMLTSTIYNETMKAIGLSRYPKGIYLVKVKVDEDIINHNICLE